MAGWGSITVNVRVSAPKVRVTDIVEALPTSVPAKVSVGAGLSYLGILLALLIREMFAVGTDQPGDTLTEVTTLLVQLAPWAGIPVMVFLSWLWIHFGRRILAVWTQGDPKKFQQPYEPSGKE